MSDALRITRQTQRLLVAFGALFAIGLVILGGYAYQGNRADNEQALSSRIQFAQNERSACITERRDTRDNAAAIVDSAAILALEANGRDDETEYSRQVERGLAAERESDEAVRSLRSDTLVRPPPVGCGKPITDNDSLEEYEGNQK